jgi:hypothetical protein
LWVVINFNKKCLLIDDIFEAFVCVYGNEVILKEARMKVTILFKGQEIIKSLIENNLNSSHMI